MMMPPPPSSHGPPMASRGMHQYPTQTDNQLAQQMQDMKLSQPMPPSPMMPNNRPYPPNNNQKMMPGSYPSDMPQFPSPQHSNRAQMSTTVTYSSQPRATYPYSNSSQQLMPPVQNSPVMTPGMNVQKTSINSNAGYQSQHGMASPVVGQLTMPQGMSSQTQKSGIDNNQDQVQTYMNQSGISNGNYTNGLINGHETSPQLQTIGSPQHPAQVPATQSFHNPNMVPQGSFHQQPRMPNIGPPNAQYQGLSNSPSSMIQSPGQLFSPSNVQPSPGMPPSPSGYQQFSPQHSAIGSTPGAVLQGPPHPGAFPPNSPTFQGMSPAHPNAANTWQTPPYQGGPPGAPGNFGYGTQNPVLQQQPQKLDLDQMPNTVSVREADMKTRGGYYATDTKGLPPPLVTTDFIVQDRGICSPRFIRSSTYCLPNQPDMLKQTGLPFAVTISPMASLHEGETEPPLCLYREQGPLRCKRCKAYVCPFMNFMEGGRCFQCAFCKVVTEVPQDYFCFLDGMGERTDKFHRPELCLGSYEYLGTKEYCRNDEQPNPPAYIFMIEVSNATFRNGMVPLLCENMKKILQCLKNDEKNDTSKLRVGFVTYNNVLHFYNMKKNLSQPHIMVLSDVHNAFVPLLEGFLVTLTEAEALVDCLMEHIPRLFVNEPAMEIILGPVIQVGLEALKNANCSGKLLVFHSTIPNSDAPGKLLHRDGQKLLGTDKQKTVILPQSDFYSKLAQDCVAAGCAVDMFLFPNAYVDIASISPLCRHTGGQLYKYTYFQSHIDGDRFLEDLERNIVTTTAFDAVLRVRTSAGISPVFYYGNFFMSNTTDIELSAIDCHKAITIEFAYDDKLPENETVYVQAALLYTTSTGERRIRVHNLAIASSVAIPDVYKCCELDTIINFFAKQALKHILDQSPQQIKSAIISKTVKILSCYRKNYSASSSTDQLILPDSLKLLPLYTNCLLKNDAIAGGPDISLDDRNFAMLAVNSMGIKSTATYFYPTLISLHEIDVNADNMPRSVRCSVEKLNDNGAYLLENGIYMFLWIGQAINQEWLQNLLGVPSTNLVDKEKTSLPELNNPLSKRIRNVIEKLEEGRQWYMRLTVMVQGDKLEVVFRQFLVDDKGIDGSPSYIEFLCHLHREIRKNL